MLTLFRKILTDLPRLIVFDQRIWELNGPVKLAQKWAPQAPKCIFSHLWHFQYKTVLENMAKVGGDGL